MRKRSEHFTPSLSNPVLFFFTEGENTEPNYIHNIIEDRIKNVKSIQTKNDIRKCIHVNKGKTGNDPKTLVEDAIREADIDTENYNCFCVFDNDNRLENKGNEQGNLLNAFALANSHHIKIIFSNPSFEYWALLHFEDTNACMDQNNAIKKLKTYMSSYSSRRKFLDYSLLKSAENKASERAKRYRSYDKDLKRLTSTTNPSVKDNPSTNADIIVSVIDDFIRKFPSR